jgi:hypothetical protein
MPQLDNVRVIDADLSALAQDYRNADYIWSALFPVVNSDKETGRIPRFNKEHFQIHKTDRALRAGSNRLNWEMKDPISISMTEHDLEFPIDMRELSEAELLDFRQRGTTVTTEAVQLRLEKAAADVAQDTATYPTDNRVTLVGGDKWSEPTTSDPLTDIDLAKDTIAASVAKDPNVIIFGRDAWRVFRRHPKILALISGGGAPGAPAVLTEEIAAKILNIKQVLVGNAIYLDAAGVTKRVWGDNVILAYVPETPPEQRSIYEPAYGYTIRKTGNPQIDTYPDNGGKIEVVRYTDLLAQAVVGAAAGYLIKDVE